MSTNAIDANYKPAYYAQAQNIVSSSGNEEESASIYETANTGEPIPTDMDYACTDGKNDGRLSTGEAIESVGKGILKSAVNMVKMPFTEAAKGNFLPALAVVAGAALCATPLGAPLAVIGGTMGIGKGLFDIGSGLAKASEIANSGEGTDGEAKAALEGVGSGILTTGLSAVAVAGGVKTIKGRAKVFAAKDGTKMNDISQRMANGEKVSFTEKAKAYASDSFEDSKFIKLTSKTKSGDAPDAPTETPATKTTEATPKSETPKPSKADTKVEVRYNSDKIQATNKNLTVEQAQAELDTANAMLQEGVDSRTLTKADYEAAQSLVKEAQANLDYAKAAEASRPQLQEDLAKALRQTAEKQGTVQPTGGNAGTTGKTPAAASNQPPKPNTPAAETSNTAILKEKLDTIVTQGKQYGFKTDVAQNSAAYKEWYTEYTNALSQYETALKVNNGGTYTPAMTISQNTFRNAQQAANSIDLNVATVTNSGIVIVPSFSY